MTTFFFFFNDTATTEIYTLSLHDALPIFHQPPFGADIMPESARAKIPGSWAGPHRSGTVVPNWVGTFHDPEDRKSTRLNSSHSQISYAVFCLKKKTIQILGSK